MLRLERLSKSLLGLLNSTERGDAMMMALITLAVGSAIIVPTLNHVNTGIKSTSVHEEITRETYAADAGIEYAMWRIKNGEGVPDTIDFDGMTIDLGVTQLEETLWGPEITGDGNQNYRLDVSTSVSDLGDPDDGLFECTITLQKTTSEQAIHITEIGAWIDKDFTYVAESTSGYFTEHDPYINEPPELRWYEDEGNWGEEKIDSGDTDPHNHVFYIQLTPGETLTSFAGWAVGQGQIGLVSSLTGYKIVAQTDDGTSITSIILADSGATTSPLSWEIN